MPEAPPTRIAVFTPATEVRSPSANAVLERALELIAASGPAIAAPILDRALTAGTITPSERARLLGEIVGSPIRSRDEPRPELVRLRHQIRAAIARAAPQLARPLLDDAVACERLTPAQQARILQRLRRGALRPLSLAA